MQRRNKISILILTALFTAAVVSAQHGAGRGPAGAGSGPRPMPPTSAARHDPGAGNGPAMDRPHPHAAPETRLPAARLEQRPVLSAKLQGLLPPGANVQDAAQGFKNMGQLVATAHVSRNLGIPFDQLKTRVTGADAVSLGKAIQGLRPDLQPDEARRQAEVAQKQAKADLKHTEQAEKPDR